MCNVQVNKVLFKLKASITIRPIKFDQKFQQFHFLSNMPNLKQPEPFSKGYLKKIGGIMLTNVPANNLGRVIIGPSINFRVSDKHFVIFYDGNKLTYGIPLALTLVD